MASREGGNVRDYARVVESALREPSPKGVLRNQQKAW